MPFSIQVQGLEELLRQLDKATGNAEHVAAEALYEGAGVMADAVSRAVHGIATEPFHYAKIEDGEKRKPSPEEKAAIVNSKAWGVAKFRKRLKKVDTIVGFNHAEYANVNFKHMSNEARTNYKAVYFKGHESNASSYLRVINRYTGKILGKGAQNQKPVGVIANAINHGTSFMEKQPFIRKAFSQSKAKATEAIEKRIKERLEELEL